MDREVTGCPIADYINHMGTILATRVARCMLIDCSIAVKVHLENICITGLRIHSIAARESSILGHECHIHNVHYPSQHLSNDPCLHRWRSSGVTRRYPSLTYSVL